MKPYLTLALVLCISTHAFGADETILPKQAPAKGPSSSVRTIAIAPQPPRAPLEATLANDPNAPFAAYQRGNYLEALQLAELRAEKNKDTRAMTLLGELYGEGIGVARDLQKSLRWYQNAAAAGDVQATFAIGMMHLQGMGMPRSKEEAAKLFRRAADKGHAHAAYNLALLYLEGQVFPQNFAEAAKLMQIAADKDIADAQHALAIFYQEGKGVPKDAAESVKWLRRAARLDHVPATIELSIALFNGNGVEKDEVTAALAMRRAALKGNPLAQNRYARMLNAGRGVEKNVPEAMAWHLMARLQDVSDPMLDGVFGGLNEQEKKRAEGIMRAWLQNKAPPNT
jgi:TPR repeat protein